MLRSIGGFENKHFTPRFLQERLVEKLHGNPQSYREYMVQTMGFTEIFSSHELIELSRTLHVHKDKPLSTEEEKVMISFLLSRLSSHSQITRVQNNQLKTAELVLLTLREYERIKNVKIDLYTNFELFDFKMAVQTVLTAVFVRLFLYPIQDFEKCIIINDALVEAQQTYRNKILYFSVHGYSDQWFKAVVESCIVLNKPCSHNREILKVLLHNCLSEDVGQRWFDRLPHEHPIVMMLRTMIK